MKTTTKQADAQKQEAKPFDFAATTKLIVTLWAKRGKIDEQLQAHLYDVWSLHFKGKTGRPETGAPTWKAYLIELGIPTTTCDRYLEAEGIKRVDRKPKHVNREHRNQKQ